MLMVSTLTEKRTEYGKSIRKQYEAGEVEEKSGISELQTDYGGSTGSTLIAARPNLVYDEITNYRIRKLTGRECFRLMGVSEADIDKIQNAGISKTQQYKMAGNSIVVDVLYYIFRKLFVDKGNEERQLTLF